MRVGLCQLNPTVGALDANVEALLDAYSQCVAAGADVAVSGELAICGYPPEDLLLKDRFVVDCERALLRFARATGACAAVVGAPWRDGDGRLRNGAVLCRDGEVIARYAKTELPTYSVFDEHRWFEPGPGDQPLVVIAGVPVGLSVCEDVWSDEGSTVRQGRAGAALLVNINGSPFHGGRPGEREALLAARSASAGAPIVYVNQVGGQDDLVFDGGSMVVAPDGTVVARLASFHEAVRIVDVNPSGPWTADDTVERVPDAIGQIWDALVLGTRDYVRKNRFDEVVIGLSGGVDSSLVAAIAVDALGSHNVHGVLMPSRFSTEHSVIDAERLATNLAIEHRKIPIEAAHAAFLDMLAPSFHGREPDVTEENLQSRIRGMTLMALSNKFGWMVLTTGNKSESAVGYSTLYGDTAGGLAVIKDVYKLAVYDLCRWRNADIGWEVIPSAVLDKAPSAELRPDQRDDQSLPPYEVLDRLLEAYIDNDGTEASLLEDGFDADVVRRVCRLVDAAEYKRRQSPPGIRVMSKAFGRDRRLPITSAYR